MRAAITTAEGDGTSPQAVSPYGGGRSPGSDALARQVGELAQEFARFAARTASGTPSPQLLEALTQLQKVNSDLVSKVDALAARLDSSAQAASRASAAPAGPGRLRRMFLPRRMTLEIEKRHGLVGKGQTLESVSLDPYVHLKAPSGGLPTGWVFIDLQLEALSTPSLQPRLYFDAGDGMNEGTIVMLPEPFDGRVRGVINLPPRVQALRLDPIDGPGRFLLGSIALTELSRFGAGTRLGLALLRDYLRQRRSLGQDFRQLANSRRQGALRPWVRQTLLEAGAARTYPEWYARYCIPSPGTRDAIAQLAQKSAASFLVLVCCDPDSSAGQLQLTLGSVAAQSLPAARVCVVGAGGLASPLSGAQQAASIEAALDAGDAAFVTFLRPGEQLDPNALLILAAAFGREPAHEIVYADEDAGTLASPSSPTFKPDWSPYRLWSQDYVQHRFAARASFLRAHRPALSSPHPFARLLLGAADAHTSVGHAPHVLHHTGASSRVAPAHEAQLRLWLETQEPGSRVGPGRLPGTVRVRLPLPSPPPVVSVIIPTRDRGELVRRCIETLRKNTTYPAYEILVVDNDTTDPATLALFDELTTSGQARVIRHPGPFNFSAINNSAVRKARGSVLVFLNNDIEVHDAGWLEEMTGWALREDVGGVGCRLLYGDGTVQHAGVVIGMEGLASHVFQHSAPDDPGQGGAALVAREAGAVTAACLVMRRGLFEEVGGFDERLAVAFNDIDLCLRLRARGKAIIYTPFAELLHLESSSRGPDTTPEKRARTAAEAARVFERNGRLARYDPYYSPNLSLADPRATLAFPPRTKKPWHNRPAGDRSVLLLAHRMMKGFGVDVVVAEQAEYLWSRGWDVTVGFFEGDGHYQGRFEAMIEGSRMRMLLVRSPEEAAALAETVGAKVVVAHTPSMYEALDLVPSSVLRVLFDHGEPPAHLFPDRADRLRTRSRKMELAARMDLTVAISEFIRRDSGLSAKEVCFNGNDHRLRRRANLARLAGKFRQEHGLWGFVVLNVARYLAAERNYKGIDQFVAVRDRFFADHPELENVVTFALAGRSTAEDRNWASQKGLKAVSNLTDDELVSAYLDADVYLSTSQWEGYNLGIAEALSLGLPAIASAQGAHSEFGIPVSNDPAVLADLVYAEYQRQSGTAMTRTGALHRLRNATLFPWSKACGQLEKLLVEGLERKGAPAVAAPAPSQSVEPVISFLILNKDKPELLGPCIRSIREHCNVPFEILVGDTGSTNEGTMEIYSDPGISVRYLGFYNFSQGNNLLAERARGRVLVCLNNDTELIKVDAKAIVDYLDQNADVGCVGGYLLYADGRIQHAGVRICTEEPYRGVPEHFDRLAAIERYPGLAGPREVVAVTGAFLIMRSAEFRALGGFDEIYEEEAQDVDLCLRVRAGGKRSVVHPAILSYHYENSTRTARESVVDREEFLSRFREEFEESIYSWQVKVGLSQPSTG